MRIIVRESGIQNNMKKYSGCSRNDLSMNSSASDKPSIQQQTNKFEVDNSDLMMNY